MAGTAGNQLWVGLSVAAPAVTHVLSAPLGAAGRPMGTEMDGPLFGLTASLVLMGLATTPLQFFLCRLLQGTFGGMVGAAEGSAGAEAPDGARGRAQRSLQSAFATGALVGSLVGGLLAEVWGLRPLLLATGVLTGLSGLVAAAVLQERARPTPTAATAHPPHRTAGALLRDSQVRALVLAGLCTQAGAFGLVTVFAPHVRGLLHGSAGAAAWVGALQAITWAATSMSAPWWGRRCDRTPVERNFVRAAGGCAVSIALQAWVGHVGWLIPLRVVQGLCFGALVQSIYLQVSRQAGAEQQGFQIGLANSFLTTGQVIGALVGGAVDTLLAPAGVIVLMGSFFGLGALLVWKIGYPQLERGVAG
jgi:MFS family permease